MQLKVAGLFNCVCRSATTWRENGLKWSKNKYKYQNKSQNLLKI